MAERNCLLPPSPNWYCSSAAECNKSGIYTFAAKSHVFLLDVNCEPPVFRGQFTEHSERVNAVACSPDCKLCSSAGEDKSVRIWDMESRTIIASHNAHQNKVTCLCWSSVSSDLVLSADEKGTIIAWKHEKNVVYSFCPIQEYVFCISASCQSEQVAAVGYKNGLIIVVQLQEQGLRLVHRLRGHDSDIHSLSWCPVSIDHLQLGHLQEKVMNSQGNLLISGSRDQTLRLWDTLNGKVLSILNLPKRASQKWKDRHDWQSKDRVWLALCWPRSLPNKMISSSHSGELLLWDLSVPSGSDQFQYFSHGHSRIVFNISCNNDGTKAVSFSMDRQIIIWDLKTLHSLHCISTLGGYVYGLDISPLDPGAVAVGVGDNMIRIWNTNSSLSTFDAVTLWQGIKSKVQVVSWHPSKEGILAFGTDVGQVGIYNTVSKKPKVFASYHKNTVYSLSWGPPCPENKDKNDDGLHLYSCSGDGSVLEHRPSQPLQDAFNVNKLIESTNGAKHKLMSCSEVSWNCDRAFLAIGNSDGTIELFRAPSLRRVCTISVHKKSITNLAWHPGYGEDNSEDEGRLPYRLASGSNETTIHIHDLSSVLNTAHQKVVRCTGDDEKSVSTITSNYRKLVGHSGRVTSLCWSPHHRDMLVSASYDGTAQIWNVESNQTISNFRGHVGRLLSVQWSFLDADVVYSGGEDGSVRAWKISEQKYSQPPASGSKTSKNKKKSKSKTTESHETKTQTNSEILPEQQATELQKPGCNDALYVASSSTEIGEKVESWRRPVTTSPVGSGDPFTPARKIDGSVAVVSVDDEDAASAGSFSAQGSGPTIIVSKSKAGESSKKKRKVKSMFPLSAVADNNTRCAMQQDCIALAQYLATKQSGAARSQDAVLPGESSNVNLGFFADRTSAYKMFEAEGRHHSSANNLDYQLQLEVWKGNLGGAIEKAIKAKQLNDWLVAMSAQGGHGVWLHTVECFANQLLSEGSYHRAVLYFLACHKVYDAIDVFKNQLMFREAIALAKVRLSPSDPVLHDLYCMWAKKLEGEHYENAAKCYLAAGLPGEAVRVLSIRGDQASLTTALKVSMVSSDLQQLSSSIAVRVMHICMETGNWFAAEEALAMCQGVEGHLSALYTHEVFVNELLQHGLIMDTEFKEQEHSKNFSSFSVGEHGSIIDNFQELPPEKSVWLVNTQPRDWFIGRILKAWDRTGTLTLQGTNLVSSIKQLSSYLQSNLNENLSIKQVLTRISYDISLGLLSGIHQDNYACALPWLQALESCIKNNYFVLAQFLCVQLLPRGTQSFEDISLLSKETNESIGSNREFLLERKPVSNDKLLSYFNGFYCLIVLYKIWFRAPEILQRFSNSSEVEIESHLSTTDSNGSEGLNASFNVAERIIAEINCNSNASLNETPVNAQNSNLCDEDGTFVKDPLPSSLQSLETSTAPNEGDLDICNVLSSVHNSLLTENIFICSTLKKQLLEVKKEVILLRSRRILDSVAASGSSKQKKATKKKNRAQQPSEESGEILVSSTAVEERNIVDKEEQDDSRQEGIQSDVLESLDVRYKSADWTLELMQEEEQRILEELSKHPLKDLPFPDPTESAIVLGHVCSKAASYPCHEPAVLYNLGLKAVNSGLEHAQWTTQRNALDQIKKCLQSMTLTDI